MLPRLAVLIALFLAPAIAIAGVRAEVSAVVGDDGVAQVRRKVLASALTETLKTIIARHLPAKERSPRRRELSAIYKNTSKYISRYTIEAEGQHRERYRLSVVAEVDHRRLLSKLEELGFAPRRVGAKPRVLTASYADEGSQALAAIVTGRFQEEGFFAAYRESPQLPEEAAPVADVAPAQDAALVETDGDKPLFEVDQYRIEALAQAANASARHIACEVLLIVEEQEEVEELEQAEDAQDVGVGDDPSAPPVVEMDEDGEPMVEDAAAIPPEEEVELKAGGYAVDVLSGFVLGTHVAVATGRGADLDTAKTDAMNKLGSELYQRFVADFTHARWTTPGEEETFEIRIEGVTSPARIESVAKALKALTEVERLTLARVEARTVVWSAKGIDPGFGWPRIASHADMGDAFLGWRVVAPPQGDEPSTGRAPRQITTSPLETPPKILLGRFELP